jgi:hypothetical protein
MELVLLIPVQFQPLHVVADGGFEESQLYYTTPQENNQAGNAGKSRENTSFPADFLPGAAGQGETASWFGVTKRLNYVRAGLDFSRNRC